MLKVKSFSRVINKTVDANSFSKCAIPIGRFALLVRQIACANLRGRRRRFLLPARLRAQTRENRRVLFAHFSNQSSIVERRKKRISRIARSQEIAKSFEQPDVENLKIKKSFVLRKHEKPSSKALAFT